MPMTDLPPELTETCKSQMTETAEDLPEGYRMTELGPLPEEWEVVRLGEVTQLVRGISWSKKEQSPDGIPVIAIPNIRGGRVSFDIRYKVAKKISEAKRLYEGDILLVGSSGSHHNVGRTAIVRGLPFRQATFASFLVKVIPSDEIEHDYIYHLLGSQMVNFVRCSKRAADGKHNLQVSALKEHFIPLPPLPEQRAIAFCLRTIQQAKEATEQVIAATRDLKKSLMRHLFTYGPVPLDQTDQVKLKETVIGVVPEKWEIEKLGNIVNVKGGKRLPKGHNFSEKTTKYPYIRVVDFSNNTINADNIKYLTHEDHIILNRYTISYKDIYISIAGTVGLVGTIPKQLDGAHLTENAAKLIIKDELSRKYLMYCLGNDPAQQQIDQLTTKTSQPKLALSRIKQILIPLPPLPEQKQIAHILQTVDRKIEAEENKRAALETLFKSMLHHLMTAKVRLPADFIARFEQEEMTA